MDKQKIDARLKELEEELVLLSGHIGESVAGQLKDTLADLDTQLATLAKEVQGSVGQSTGDQKTLANDLSAAAMKLGSISTVLDAIGNALGVSDSKPPKTALPDQLDTVVGDAAASIKNDIDGVTGTLDKRIGDIATSLKNDLNGVTETLEKRIGDATGTIADSVSNQEAGTKKRHDELSGMLTDLKLRSEELTELLKNGDIKSLGTKIGGMEKSVTDAASSLTDLPKQLEKQTGAISKDVTGALDKAAADREEIKNTLMRDHDELHRALEIIRRMCTTDEEKYLGSVVSLLHEQLASLPETIEALKQKQGTLDKNIQIASQNNMTKQDEVKKVLLYDIGSIVETTGFIHEMCDTGDDTPLGAQVSAMATRTEDVPAILEHVSSMTSRMDSLVMQVRLMRWFVLGAVGVSLVVLIMSFIR